MTVKQLREIMSHAADDAVVVAPSSDHSYRNATAQVTTGLYDAKLGWSEDYGEGSTPEAEFGKRLPILVIA